MAKADDIDPTLISLLGGMDPSQLSSYGQFLLSGESELQGENLISALNDELSLAASIAQADADRDKALQNASSVQGQTQEQTQEENKEQPTTPSFFMNPFGASSQSMPSIFGSDLQNQEAIDQLSNITDIGLKVIGARDPRSPELLAQLEEEGVETFGGPGPLEAFIPGGVISKGPKIFGGLQKTSQLPVPRTGQLPDVPGGRPPAVRTGQSPEVVTTPPSTFVRGTGPRPIDAEVSDVTKGGSVIPSLATLALGGALATDQAMQDPSQNPSQEQVATAPEGVAPTRPKSPIEIHTEYLGFLKDQGVSDDERTEIAAKMIAPFLANSGQRMGEYLGRPTEPNRGSTVDTTTQPSETDDSSEDSTTEMTLSDYKNIARAAGFKGSQVNSKAKELMAEAKRKEAESAADIEATKALTDSRKTPKAKTIDKDLADIESRFSQVGIPFRNAQGDLTNAAKEALLAKGRIPEQFMGSGLEETILLDRKGKKRSVPKEQVEEALASGYTRFVQDS